MKEIELKFRIDNEAETIKNLNRIGCKYINYSIQSDVVFSNDKNINFNKMEPNTILLRIRKEQKKTYLTLKKSSTRSYECEEIEFEVCDSKKIYNFVEALGFTKIMEFTKGRKQFVYNELNICIDNIDDLGTYIEIEHLTNKDDSENIRNKILDFAKLININIDRIESRYYPQIILDNQRMRSDDNDKKNRCSYNI